MFKTIDFFFFQAKSSCLPLFQCCFSYFFSMLVKVNVLSVRYSSVPGIQPPVLYSLMKLMLCALGGLTVKWVCLQIAPQINTLSYSFCDIADNRSTQKGISQEKQSTRLTAIWGKMCWSSFIKLNTFFSIHIQKKYPEKFRLSYWVWLWDVAIMELAFTSQ